MRDRKRRASKVRITVLAERLARMERRSDVRTIEALCRRRGKAAWLVGGALRDLLLDRSPAELDLAVPGDPWPLARELEGLGLGTAVSLSNVPPRVARVAGRREVDLAELAGGSIEEDLARRDFTVNAMAWELRGRRLIDPFGGERDLAARRLRMISARNLKDDPLRVLRAARLMATHGLRPDAALTGAAAAAAGELGATAPERIRTEIVKLLDSDSVAAALRWLWRAGAAQAALDPPIALPGLSRALLARLDDPTVRRLPPADRREIRLSLIAAWLRLPPSEAARWLARRRFSREESGGVAALLERAARARTIRKPRDAWAWIRDSGPRRAEAQALLRLLLPGRPRLVRRLASLRPRRPVRISGSDVMEWLQIPAGPRIGALLRDLEIESLRGHIRTRPGARRWLEENGRGGDSPSPLGPGLGCGYNSVP